MRIHPVVTDKNERYNQLDWVQLTLILRKYYLRACAAASAAFVVVVRAGRGRWGEWGWKREKRDQASKV